MKTKSFILFSVVFILAIVLLFLPRRAIDILPNKNEVESVSIKKDNEIVQTTDKDIISNIIDNIENARKTFRSSTNDQPLENQFITIVFTRDNEQTDTFYLYQSKNDYFLEKPYEGIYRISQEIEENIISLFNSLSNR